MNPNLVETFYLISGIAAFGAAFYAWFPPGFRWTINTEFFLKVVFEEITGDELERVLKLCAAAPSAFVVRLLVAFIKTGKESAIQEHAEARNLWRRQRIKLIGAGFVTVPAVGLSIHSLVTQEPEWPLLISAACSLVLILAGARSIRNLERDCQYFLKVWVVQLSNVIPPELRDQIRGLD